jgi:16S rRNA (uracil1498-N3)-methyltransferase
MHSFFADKDLISSDAIKIVGDDASHISKVLRIKIGEEIIVCDGEGTEYLCVIDSIGKKNVSCKIKSKMKNESEPPIKVDLYQGIPKSTKMDIIIQKTVEMGINSITLVNTERVIVKAFDKDSSNKYTRYRRIAEEAAKQSGRGKIPDVLDAISFKDVIDGICKYDIAIIPYENEKSMGLKNILNDNKNFKNIAIFIGPEGGFTEEEINYAKTKGVIPITLGPRILRTETAGFVCLSQLMYAIGDMGGIL